MSWMKKPEIGEINDFKLVDEYNKKHHPIQYFFKETIPDFWTTVVYKVKAVKWYILHRIHPNHRYHIVKTSLKPGYYDITYLMIYTLFSLLERFVEDERCFEVINWDATTHHYCVAGELKDLYYWWKNVRPEYENEIDNLYEKITVDHLSYKNITDEEREIFRHIDILEERNRTTDIYMMKRLVSIKDYMWT